MKDDLRYTPSDCFETFPFPDNWHVRTALEAAGKDYYEFRAALMTKNEEGLTKLQPLPLSRGTRQRHPEVTRVARRHGSRCARCLRLD